jgi:signal transduction histidine kinase
VLRVVGVVRERVGAGRAGCRWRGVVVGLPVSRWVVLERDSGCDLGGGRSAVLVEYVQWVSRVEFLARTCWFDLLVGLLAIVAMVDVVLGRGSSGAPTATLWFCLPALAILVLPVFARRWFRFAGPAGYWLLAAGISFVDPLLVPYPESVFLLGLAVAFLLGNVRDVRRAGLGLAIAVGAAAIVVYKIPGRSVDQLVFIPVDFAVAWVAGFAVRARAERAEVAELRAAQAEHAVVEERVRIARELHDVVAHHVSMMGVQAGGARVVIDSDRVKAKEALSAIEVSSRQAVGELHRLLGFLRQPGEEDDLAPRPGLSRLARLAASMGESGLVVVVSVEGEERLLPPMIGVSAYRIVQEALTNALKHAAASRADVCVRYWPDELEVEIIDDGRGAMSLSGASPGGLGLIGMRERAALHGGRLTAGPGSGGGFAVRVKLPTSGGGL